MAGLEAGMLMGGWSVSVSGFRMVAAEIFKDDILKIGDFQCSRDKKYALC